MKPEYKEIAKKIGLLVTSCLLLFKGQDEIRKKITKQLHQSLAVELYRYLLTSAAILLNYKMEKKEK